MYIILELANTFTFSTQNLQYFIYWIFCSKNSFKTQLFFKFCLLTIFISREKLRIFCSKKSVKTLLQFLPSDNFHFTRKIAKFFLLEKIRKNAFQYICWLYIFIMLSGQNLHFRQFATSLFDLRSNWNWEKHVYFQNCH